MPRAALTDEQVHSFRLRAAQVATALFAEEGYRAVTLRSLAAALGVSPMTPYRYFENKEDLFATVRTEAFRRFADAQRDAARGVDDPEQALRCLGKAYVEFALREPNAYRIMFELRQAPAGTYPELEKEQARAFSYLHEAVEAVFEAEGRDGDPLRQAHLMWAQVHGLVSLHLAEKLLLGCSLEDLLGEAVGESDASG